MVENIAAILRQTALHADASKLSDLQIDDTHCFICQMLKKIEKSYIQEVYQALQSPDGQRLYNKPHGLCLRHLEQLFKIISDTTLKSFLLEHAAKKLENFAEDMKSFALKHETIHRDLQNDNERKAYDYATIHIVGEKNSWVL